MLSESGPGQESPGQWLRRLEGPGGLRPASHPPMIAEATQRLEESAVRWAIDLGHRMASRIIAAVPELGGGDEAFETLRMGTESAVLNALLVLLSDDLAGAKVSEEGLLGDQEWVRRGIRLDLVLRGVRLGHAQLTMELLAAALVLVPEERRAVEMERMSALLFEFIDVYSETMAIEYLAEHDRWVTSAAAERAEVVRQLLGDSPPPGERASRVLSYPLDRHHLAMVLSQPSGAGRAPTDLQHAAALLLREAGCTASLEVPHGTNSLWVWGSWRSRESVVVEFDLTLPQGIRVAVGSLGRGIAGFRQSHLEALRVAEQMRSTERVGLTHYRDVELAVLLAHDLANARVFVARELGVAAANTASAAELRATVAAYLQHDRSLARAGEELHVARNTVAYRVKRFEELTGRDPRVRRLELEAALRLVAALGSQVLAAQAGDAPAPRPPT